jgi:transposase
MRRVVGMDIHRTFAEVVFWESGQLRPAGRIDMTRAGLEGFGRRLNKEDEVVVEATGNAMAVVRALEAYVARVIVANPLQVKTIAYAHVKTDKIDAGVLASLRAANFLPEIWLPDADTERRRRQIARRNQVVRHRTRIKNEVHAILHAHLIPRCPHDLFGRPGRHWLERQMLPDDERATIARHLRELDRLGEDLDALDRDIAQAVMDDPAVKRLLTITGVNLIVAAGLVAAIGDVRRFVSWPEPARPSVGPRPRPAWPHQQTGPLARSRHAGGGSLGSSQGAGTTALVLSACPNPARSSGGRRRRRAQVGSALLASADEGYRLSLGAARLGGEQNARDGIAGGTTSQTGQQARLGVRLQRQRAARSGNQRRSTSRTGIRTICPWMAAARSGNAALGRRQ